MNNENINMNFILQDENEKKKKRFNRENNFLNDNENFDSSFNNINLINKNTIKAFNDITIFSSKNSNKIKDISIISNKKKIDDSEIKTKKLINSLNETKNYLQNKINSIHNNRDYYLNESFQSFPNLKIDYNIRKYNINEIKNKENIIKEKLSAIQNQIELIIEKENKKDLNRKKNIENYIEKLETKKDSFAKLKNIVKESNILRKKKLDDLTKSIMKKIEYFDKIEEDKIQKKNQLIQNIKLNEIDVIEKRKLELKKYDSLVKKKPSLNKDKNEYLFEKMKKQYEEEDNKYKLNKLNERHKIYSNNSNIQEFNNLLKRKKLVYELESFEKIKSMREMWLNRSKIINSFKTKFDENRIKEEKKEKEDLENKKLKKILLYKYRKIYSENKVFIPKKCMRLIKEMENRIKKPKSQKIFNIQKEYSYDSKNIKESIKNNNNKSSLKNHSPTNNQQKLKMILSDDKISNPLNQLYIKNPCFKSKNLLKNSISNIDLLNKNKKKDKYSLLKDRLIEYDQMRNKSQIIEQKIENVKELIKYNGGLNNNINIGEKLDDLLIDSLKSKIKTLKLVIKNI